jgi:hypothetical protein
MYSKKKVANVIGSPVYGVMEGTRERAMNISSNPVAPKGTAAVPKPMK